MAFENWKLNRKVHKQEKKIAKKEELAQTTVRANDSMTNITNRTEKVKEKLNAEEWYSKHLDRANLDTEIHEARQNLFIQRERLLRRLITFNREYKYILQKPDTSIKRRELERCSTGAKNAAYALAIVDEAIDRLDNIRSEHEWRDIMRDLTKGYKLVNAHDPPRILDAESEERNQGRYLGRGDGVLLRNAHRQASRGADRLRKGCRYADRKLRS